MKISFSRLKEMRSPAEGWTRARAILLLHLTLVIATSYLLLAQRELRQVESVTAWLILGALLSTLAFLWLPRQLIESSKFGASLALMTLGTVLVSVAYLYSVFTAQGAAVAWSSATLIRLPFFFAAAALYGFLTDQARRERQTGERLRRSVRRTDLLGRFRNEELDAASRLGGDEFAVVLNVVKDLDCVGDTRHSA